MLRDDGPMWVPWRRTIHVAARIMAGKPLGKPDFADLAAECRAAVKPEALAWLAQSLGVSTASLQRLRVGWSTRYSGWSFPMSDAGGPR